MWYIPSVYYRTLNLEPQNGTTVYAISPKNRPEVLRKISLPKIKLLVNKSLGWSFCYASRVKQVVRCKFFVAIHLPVIKGNVVYGKEIPESLN